MRGLLLQGTSSDRIIVVVVTAVVVVVVRSDIMKVVHTHYTVGFFVGRA